MENLFHKAQEEEPQIIIKAEYSDEEILAIVKKHFNHQKVIKVQIQEDCTHDLKYYLNIIRNEIKSYILEVKDDKFIISKKKIKGSDIHNKYGKLYPSNFYKKNVKIDENQELSEEKTEISNGESVEKENQQPSEINQISTVSIEKPEIIESKEISGQKSSEIAQTQKDKPNKASINQKYYKDKPNNQNQVERNRPSYKRDRRDNQYRSEKPSFDRNRSSYKRDKRENHYRSEKPDEMSVESNRQPFKKAERRPYNRVSRLE